MSVQIIEKDGRPEWAVVPYQEYLRLMELAEDRAEIAAYDAAMRAIEEGEELIPSEVVDRLINGENRIKVWREHRGLSQKELADLAEVKQSAIAMLETGARTGTVETLQRIARALQVDLDDVARPVS